MTPLLWSGVARQRKRRMGFIEADLCVERASIIATVFQAVNDGAVVENDAFCRLLTVTDRAVGAGDGAQA